MLSKALFAFVAVTAGTLLCRAITGIAHVDGRQRTALTVVVMAAARHVTSNTLINRSFDHKNTSLPLG